MNFIYMQNYATIVSTPIVIIVSIVHEIITMFMQSEKSWLFPAA